MALTRIGRQVAAGQSGGRICWFPAGDRDSALSDLC